MENIKSKKQMFLVLGVAFLMVTLGGVTFAFYNYTRTGEANTVQTGDIRFNAEEGTAINLTNAFPVDVSSGIPNDPDNVGSVTIHVTGSTTYNEGVEYLVSAVNVSNTVGSGNNAKTVPISIDVSYTSTTGKTIGTSDSSYYTNRNTTNSSIYKVLANETVATGDELVVGYIAPGQTGIDGNIVIRAFYDMSKIAISDTLQDGDIVVPNTTNGTTSNWVNNRVVFTTSEWNSLRANGVSFQIKVEANEGIWVEEPPRLAYETIIENVDTVTQINFANASSASNGQGLYILPGTEGNTNPIYYYRGAVENNNVVFAGFCWQMVRTTDTGGIKMIYNGIPDVEGSGNNITYNCGPTRTIQSNIQSTLDLKQTSTGYYYADDYETIGKLKQFTDARGICVLVVHHTRKQRAEDIFEMISGTNGLMGAADGAMILNKEKRTSMNAALAITGRDQPDQTIYLVRDETRLV